MIQAARDEVDSVDVVVTPESALNESEVAALETLLHKLGVVMLIAGVRQTLLQRERTPGNWVHIGTSAGLLKVESREYAGVEQWFHIRQNKHHRWSLDEKQIYQYHLGGALHPSLRWWERTEIPRRNLQFIGLGDEANLVSLVCEDLAQIDDVLRIVR